MDIVEFPGLGLRIPVKREAVENLFGIEGFDIYWYGIIIALGFLLAVVLGMRDSRKLGLEPDNVIDLVLFAAPVAIVTSRLYYVAFSWQDFRGDLLQIFNTRKGGLAIYGGVIGAIIVAYFFAKKKKIGVLKLFDFGAPYLILAQGIGRWGNFVNQEAYGINTTLPWGMTGDAIKKDLLYNMERLEGLGIRVDPNVPVHPTFLYESLWNIGTFVFLLWFRKRKKLEGEVFLLYMILYGAGRFWIEALRTDSLMLGNVRISQLLAAVFAITLTVLFFLRRKRRAEAEEVVEIGTSRYGEILRKLQEDGGGSPADKADDQEAADETEDVPTDEDEDGAVSEAEDRDG